MKTDNQQAAHRIDRAAIRLKQALLELSYAGILIDTANLARLNGLTDEAIRLALIEAERLRKLDVEVS